MRRQTQRAVEDGIFEGVNPKILDWVEATFPVGLRSDHGLDMPVNYDPSSQVPVLMLGPNEWLPIDTTPYLRTIVRRLGRAGIALQDADMWAYRVHRTADLSSHVVSPAPLLKDKSAGFAVLPLLVCIRDAGIAGELAEDIAHELDHWDFVAMFGYNPPATNVAYGMKEFKVAMERRAYATSYRLEHNRGLHKHLPTVEELVRVAGSAERYPEEFGRIVAETVGAALRASPAVVSISGALSAMAATAQYADPATGGITEHEIRAYQGSGLVAY